MEKTGKKRKCRHSSQIWGLAEMDDKHQCKYPGCNSILHRGHEGEYCYTHEEREDELDQTPDSSVKGDVAAKEELYTVKDLTGILKYSDRSIRDMLNEGKIKGLRVGDRGKWLVPESEIARFKKEGPRETQTTPALISTEDIKKHDTRMFRQADSIMSEAQVKDLLLRLKIGQRCSGTDFDMLLNFVRVLHFSSDNYINPELRDIRKKLYITAKKLIIFIKLNFETMQKASLFHDEVRWLKYRPNIAGVDRRTEYQDLEEKLNQLADSTEEIYCKYRDTVKKALAI